jgi:hypothetical protein
MVALMIAGLILIGVAALWVLADWDRPSARMPTQVLPRRAAWYPFVAGAVLVVTGLVVGLSRGLP